ncbi:uncharacterized protein LOC135488533 [Lineus longissimus]|uniref:uncharacterized protein LOC135488533 n=1 Tax=Lineus longissimus TaxID=88925 RepID=UPI00315C54F8
MATPRRSSRQTKLPSYLKDYVLKTYQKYAPESHSSDSSVVDRLRIQRDFIAEDVDIYCKKVYDTITERGSKSTLKRLGKRMDQSYSELKEVTEELLKEDPDDVKESVTILNKARRKIAEHQDEIAENLETREDEASSASTSSRSRSNKPKLVHSPIDPREILEDLGNEDEDEISDEGSIKAKEAEIKFKVAALRVCQEKQRLEEERHLREAERQLLLQKQRDEAERAEVEMELWHLTEIPPGGIRSEPLETPHHAHTEPLPLRTSTEIKKVKIEEPPLSSIPKQTVKKESSMNQVPPDMKDTMSKSAPYTSHRSSEEKDSAELRRFFQGMAKPKLPHFGGEKGQYHDWWEQFDVFVHKTEVPVRFKMIMLKSCLTGTPLELVQRLGYTEVQYQMAIEKLETRYGGEKRLIQQHIEAIMAIIPLKEENLKGLADFANKLFDIVAKLKDAGQERELNGASALYTIALQKIPDRLLIQYQDTLPLSSVDGLTSFTKWLNRQVSIRLEMAELKEPVKKQYQGGTSTSSSRKSRSDNRSTHKSQAHSSETSKKVSKPLEKGAKGTQIASVQRPSSTTSTSKSNCPLCSDQHLVTKCPKWYKTSVSERWKLAKENDICFRCLKVGHRGRSCESTIKCNIDGCPKTHHRSLHPTTQSQVEEPKVEAQGHFGISEEGKVTPTRVALRVTPVTLIGADGKKRRVNAFMDDGSDSSYIRTEIAEALGLLIEKNDLTLSTLVDKGTKVPSGLVSLTIESLDGETRRKIGARTPTSMCEGLCSPDWQSLRNNWEHLKGIEFPKVDHKKVDLLIGSDHPELTMSLEERIGKPGEPVARKTPLGWTCVGMLHSPSNTSNVHFTQAGYTVDRDIDLDTGLKRLWNMDVVHHETKELFTKEEQSALDKASASLEYREGRYQIGIPWKENRPSLPDNRAVAERRLKSLENHLKKKPEVADRYKEVLEANIEKGYIRKVPAEELEQPGWYLPHFGVVREDRATTKVRVVYDGAAVYDGKSLNDEMWSGPKLQLDVLDILVTFRRGAVALVGDIREMFSQIILAPEDRRFHRILWRGLDTSSPIEVYEAVRHPFGDRASPFLAQYVVRSHAENNENEYPLAAQTCRNRVYMDDAIDSLDTIKMGKDLRRQLAEMLKLAGFDIRKWCSNSVELLLDVPEEDRAPGIIDLDESELPSIKTLGVRWDAERDIIGFSYTDVTLEITSKRTVLSLIARLFDPLQLLAPFVIRAKMILQLAWIEGLGWDEPFPSHMEKQVRVWVDELPEVAQFAVPRCYKQDSSEETAIHTFSDASSQAYGAVIYVRSRYTDGSISVQIIMAKARVTPLKAVSIPRLELMAALLGLRLAIRVRELLGITTLCFWTDSTDVIHWLHGESRRYKPFVYHRIAEMQDKTNPSQWRHVPGILNPADMTTRGAALADLVGEKL